VFDRRHSRLTELSTLLPLPASAAADESNGENDPEEEQVISYVNRLSQLTGSLMRCFPILRFLEVILSASDY
jgi:hypothetical protein